MSVWSQFHFVRPWWFLSFIPALVLLLVLLRAKTAQSSWTSHCDPHLLEHLLVGQGARKSIVLPWVIFVLWSMAIIALAGPTWSHYPQPVYQKVQARVIALDVSQSMNANDILPTRLERARFKILDLLKAIKEGQTGMIVFSSEPFIVSPLTSDNNTIANMVPALDSNVVPVQGHDIFKALEQAAKLITQAGFEEGEIIVITASTPSQDALDEARKLASKGIKTSVIAIGTAQGGPIKNDQGGFVTNQKGEIAFANMDERALQKLSQVGNGQFSLLTDNDQDIKAMLRDSIESKTQKQMDGQKVNALWKDEGHWLIWLLIMVVAFIARKGWLEKVCR